MADTHGDPRALAAPSSLDPARTLPASGVAATCPECGSAVRPEQDWCSLCLHVLRPAVAPTPPPMPVTTAALVTPRVAAPRHLLDDPALDAAAGGAPGAAADRLAARSEVEAAAALMLTQLAAQTRSGQLSVPPVLRTRGGVAAAAAVGTVVLVGLGLLLLTVLGAVFS